MSKDQLVAQIMSLNRSARAEFLAQFDEMELAQYLRKLQMIADLPPDFRDEIEPEPAVQPA